MTKQEKPSWKYVGFYHLHELLEAGPGHQTWLATTERGETLYELELAAFMEPEAFHPGNVPTHPGARAAWDLGTADGQKSAAGWHRAVYLSRQLPRGASVVDLAGAAQERGERLPLAEVCNIGSQIARALHACHVQRQGVHGRLRPKDIYVEPSGLVLVGGFEGGLRVGPTSPRELGYWSPEHVLGAPLLPVSDVYSLGILLYELATGRRVVDTRAFGAAVRSLISTRPAPSELAPGLPAAFDALVGRALDPRAAERFGSAEALASALDALEREHTEARHNDHVAELNQRLCGLLMRRRAELREELTAAMARARGQGLEPSS